MQPKPAPLAKPLLFWSLIVLADAVLVTFGIYMYHSAGKSAELKSKVGEYVLNLAFLVIVGALLKTAIDWVTSQRARYRADLDARQDFLRRVRAMHVSIQNARDLMNAHESARTWAEQSRRLMQIRPEVEEISEDLKASGSLFNKQPEIIEGLEAIGRYLAAGGDEYVRCHKAVDSNAKSKTLSQTIRDEHMHWVADLMESGPQYQECYEKTFAKSKRAMRAEVYRAKHNSKGEIMHYPNSSHYIVRTALYEEMNEGRIWIYNEQLKDQLNRRRRVVRLRTCF